MQIFILVQQSNFFLTFFLSKQHSWHILPYYLQHRHSSSSALLSVALSLAVAETNRTSQHHDKGTTASSIVHIITIQNSVCPACNSCYLTFTKWKCLSPLIETFAIETLWKGWIEQLLKSSNWHGYECLKKSGAWNKTYVYSLQTALACLHMGPAETALLKSSEEGSSKSISSPQAWSHNSPVHNRDHCNNAL